MKRRRLSFLLVLACAGSVGSAQGSWSWIEEAKLTDAQGAELERFGKAVVLADTRALIGAPGDAISGSYSGSAYAFVRIGGAWHQYAELSASDGEASDHFGQSVALEGDTYLVGAPWGGLPGPVDPGAVYVFGSSGSGLTQLDKLSSDVGSHGDLFGKSVTLEGNTAVVGAPLYGEPGVPPGVIPDAGAAFVFARSGTAWSQKIRLHANDAEEGDEFGYSVSLSGDRLLIGAPYDDDFGRWSGSAYVFARSGTTWSQEAKLTASDAEEYAHFGWSVDLDGDTALIGSMRSGLTGTGTGAAYVFVRSGTAWSQQARLIPDGVVGIINFGWSVALEGDSAAIGAPIEGPPHAKTGATYLMARTGTAWSQVARIVPTDGETDDYFGSAVDTLGDIVLAGADGEDTYGWESGAAYAYRTCDSSASESEVVRLGVPPNPNALAPGVTTGPIVGADWDPVVNPFLSGAFADFIGVDLVGPLNVPTAWGTLLITPPPGSQLFLNSSPGTPFSLSVPFDCGLIGAPGWAQGGSVAPGLTVALTNALDLVFGSP